MCEDLIVPKKREKSPETGHLDFKLMPVSLSPMWGRKTRGWCMSCPCMHHPFSDRRRRVQPSGETQVPWEGQGLLPSCSWRLSQVYTWAALTGQIKSSLGTSQREERRIGGKGYSFTASKRRHSMFAWCMTRRWESRRLFLTSGRGYVRTWLGLHAAYRKSVGRPRRGPVLQMWSEQHHLVDYTADRRNNCKVCQEEIKRQERDTSKNVYVSSFTTGLVTYIYVSSLLRIVSLPITNVSSFNR